MYMGQDLPIQPVLQLGFREKGQQEVTTTHPQVVFENSIEFYQVWWLFTTNCRCAINS